MSANELPEPVAGWPPPRPPLEIGCPDDFDLAAFLERTEPLVRAAQAKFAQRAGTREHWVDRRRMRIR